MFTALRLGAAAAACALGAVCFAGPAVAAEPADVSWNCEARPPIGAPQYLTLGAAVEAVAPATVAPGQAFEISLTPQPATVPATANGFPVNNLANLQLRVPVPAGTTLTGVTLTGGVNLGDAVPAVAEAGGVVTLTVPGPLAGGSAIQLPAIHLALTATGEAGTAVTTRLAGTSYADPGLTYVANVKTIFGNFDVPAGCFADPSPVLSSTAIQAA